ncbi:TonB-dependent siderophore receptor [Methylobacterium dankookense]|uniref:Ferrichrome-iron receptor n=1 Tax=Methylobacterium dankookense TaxID=560405 RepID=A0A564G040_9HYPH|nr:TonB-dependent siderophore receptor [Methylobacterium dankookense]GJD54306.1 Metal-pseudopaline receptor CntO [Methylobacterium dankookense]VUF13001.1 Ferrichrome-iron receptor [Methylobacterium dankookense]
MIRIHPLAGLIAGVSLVTSAAAQQSASDPVITLDELSVTSERPISRGYQPVRSSLATRSETPLLRVPQAVAVVTEQVLQDQQVRSLDEALVNVSGITQTNTVGGQRDAFIRRGFGENGDGSILRDGLRTALQRSFMPTTQRVEVLKGPASALYGILDSGGLINIVTKKPRFVEAGYVETWGTSFGGGGVELDHTGPIAGTSLAYRFIAQGRNQEYWRDFGMQSQQVVAPSLTWEGDDTRVTLAYEWSHYRMPFDRGTIFDPRTGKPVRVPRERRFDERWSNTTGENHVASLSVERALADTWKATFDYAFSHNFFEDNQTRRVSFNPVTGILTRRADATQDANTSVHAARLDVVGRENLLGFGHEFLLGASYDYFEATRSRLIRGANDARFNIYAPVYGRLAPSFTVVARDSNQLERLSTPSVYAQDTISLTDRLTVVGGLRYQYFDQIAGRGLPFVRNTDVSGGRVVPRVGLVYLLADGLSAYGSYSQTFRPNTSVATAIGALPPEEGEAYEIGLKMEVADGVTATAALYDIVKSNVLYTEVVDGITYSRTAGRVGSRGFELDVAGRIAEGWSAIATYAYTDVTVLADPTLKGNTLPNVAPHTASLFLTHDFGPVGGGRLRAGLGGRYVGVRAGDAANTFTLPDYAVLDAFLAYDTEVVGRPATVQLNLRNLTDETYYLSSLGTNTLGVAVGEPFQALVSARLFW